LAQPHFAAPPRAVLAAVAESSPLGRRYEPTDLWSRSLLHALHVFARDVSKASTSGVNPLPYADEDTVGAFVCLNLNEELPAAWASYLAGKLLARLHTRRDGTPASPPLADYCRKKDASATKTRYEMEHDWAWDDVAEQYCVVYALAGAILAARADTMRTLQPRHAAAAANSRAQLRRGHASDAWRA
jgi:hypothetical protein